MRVVLTSFGILVVLALIVDTTGAFPGLQGHGKLVDGHSATVVRLFVQDADGLIVPSGSGYVAQVGVIVSARRAFRDGKRVFVKTAHERLLVPVVQDPPSFGSDIDVFRAPALRVKPIEVVWRKAVVGETVTAIGSAGLGESTASGVITRVPFAVGDAAHVAEEYPWMIACKAVVSTEIAGGLLIAADGSVLGVTTGVISADGVNTFAVPAETIQKQLTPLETVKDSRPSPPHDSSSDEANKRAVGGTVLVFPSESIPDSSVVDIDRLGDPNARYGPGPDGGSGKGGNYGTGTSNVGVAAGTRADAGLAKKPVALGKVKVFLTPLALANGTEGSVLVEFVVGKDGLVKSSKILRGLPDGLSEQVIAALREVRFEPATDSEGRPVDCRLSQEIRFQNPNAPVHLFWAGTYDGENTRIQIFLRCARDGSVRGYVLVENEKDRIEYSSLEGVISKGVFRLKHVEAGSRCTVEWMGRLTAERLQAREMRSCSGSSEAAFRDLTALKLNWANDDSRPAR